MPLNSQLGAKAESAYGTAVAVDRFWEFVNENIQPQRKVLADQSLRSSGLVQANARTRPYIIGYAGPVSLVPHTEGFGWWINQAMGTITTSGLVDSCYTHIGTLASLYGDSFSLQVNKRDEITENDRPYSYEGGKIAKWSIDSKVDDYLMFNAEMVFEDGGTGTSLASASYPTGEPFHFVGASISFDGTEVPVESFKLEVDNNLTLERVKQRAAGARRQEPVAAGRRSINWEMVCDYDALTEYTRVIAETASGASVTGTALWTGDTIAGSATYPSLQIDMTNAFFDTSEIAVQDHSPSKQTIKGRGHWDLSNPPLLVTYVSTDATP